jgi:hypothetical protein
MNPVRFSILRSTVARILKQTKPMLYPETLLLNDVRLLVDQAATEVEFRHVIQRMEAARQILRISSDDEGVKVKLTELGEAELNP